MEFAEIFRNKKVLLRERKRFTACHVASARYAALSNGEGVPHPVLVVGGTLPTTTMQTWSGGVPPTIQTWSWGSPGTPLPPSRPGMGYPPPRPEMGNPLPPTHRPGMRYPPPPQKCRQTENITFPHPSDAGGKNDFCILTSYLLCKRLAC